MSDTKKITKIIVDRNMCIGAASCVVSLPSVFELDNENKAVILQKAGVKNSGPSEVTALSSEGVGDAELLAAAQTCPTQAISLYAEDGSKVFP